MKELWHNFDPLHWAFLKKIGQCCAEAGGEAYLVGGCVRSALLGEPVNDFDVEVFGLLPEILEKVLKSLAPVTKVGKAFGVYKLAGWPIDIGLPREEEKTGTGHCGFEVRIDPKMPLRKAALRRDFTINAVYFDLMRETLSDPLGGQADLDRRVIRHCSEQFHEDPLRVLRAMQFAARLPATVAPETVAICKGLHPEGLSKERYFGEWEKLILLGKIPSRGLDFLKECGWVAHFPDLQALIDCPQDPQWHPEGDVWQHTLHCLDAFAARRTGDREEDLIVGLATLCHDFGKPATTESSEGRIRSHGHERAGLKPARRFLSQLNVPVRLVEQILPLIECHMRPLGLFQRQSSPAAIRRLARDCGRLDRLLRLVEADAAGRPPMPSDVQSAVEWIRAKARELAVERNVPQALLSGHDLLKGGWQTGPALGRFLQEAYEQQLDGTFTTREEALRWLENQLAGGKSSSEDNHASSSEE